MTSVLSGYGISVDLPLGWEGRIMLRTPPRLPHPVGQLQPAASPVPAEIAHPVVHLANFALPAERGDFGSGAVDLMGANNVLMVLFEHGPQSAGAPLFNRKRPAVLRPADFSPHALQRTLAGQVGFQCFFTEAGRAFCLYAVLGWRRNARTLAALATHTWSAVEIEAP
ncbi:MAG: hypothetical protein JWL70_1316 [Acidimicrobiia bacterium]|nr:hypothetical protein [Acidimicrobiia bacterium]